MLGSESKLVPPAALVAPFEWTNDATLELIRLRRDYHNDFEFVSNNRHERIWQNISNDLLNNGGFAASPAQCRRKWYSLKYGDSSNVGYETNKKFKNLFNDFIRKKGKNFFVALYLTAFSAFLLHLVSVLFGAPLFHNVQNTLMFAIYVSLLGIFPPAVAFKTHGPYWSRVFSDFNPETIPEKMVYYSTVGTIIGAWAGAIVIPLDWDRSWQVWPISCVISAYIGHVIGSILAVIVCYFNPESSTLRKKRR
ncbi:2208_t:CDS:2 [Funneliformis geosporum]|uniref:2208_t:CDS:1 n=1 Tax=Funneliformis geosporum TaxID=1117311 RepID=A0A9W4SCT5_9GLOM|nr:2208_t:CDS:2 [Funneliformis geosporum]